MKKFTLVFCSTLSLCSLVSLTSCYKGLLQDITASNGELKSAKFIKDSSEVSKLLTAQTWQIEEVNEIISISSAKVVYKANDGSILTLTPVKDAHIAL